jgi:putative ABC transport system permease protein
MTGAYRKIFSIPIMQIRIYWDVLSIGIGLSTGFSLLAGWNSAKRIMNIHPAQAMRSETPKSGHRIFLEQFHGFWQHLSFSWKMSLRNLGRSPQRTFLTFLGIIFTIMFFMVSLFFLDVIEFILNQHFFVMQRQDYKVVFTKPASYEDAKELKSIDGIRRSEPILEVPMEIKHQWMKEDVMTVGMDPGQRLYRLIDIERRPMVLPPRGLLIAQAIAGKLKVRPGDTVLLRPYIGRAEEREVIVSGITKEYAGFNCYMNLRELGDVIGEGKCASGALIKVAAGRDDRIKRELFKYHGIETVEGRIHTYRSFKDMLEFTTLMFGFMIAFGSVMGFAIIFNTTVINIMERRRELASLKVLGYRRWEIERTILRENLLIGISSLIPGVLLGRFMCELFGRQFSNELFAMEVIISPKTYVTTISLVFIFLLSAQWANRKNITGLDMVEVLKNKEG